MKIKSGITALIGFVFASAAQVAFAHPGHEPDDFFHAIAHELASPRGIVALLVLGVGVALWIGNKGGRRK